MRILAVERVTGPVGLPVTVDEFIDHARLNGLTVDRQPDLIQRELTAATMRAERYLRRSIMTQTLKGYWDTDRLSCDTRIVLPRGRVQSVSTVSGASGSPVLDPAAYQITGAVITLQSPAYTPMSVIWVSGYGDEPEDVPDSVREGILEYATVLYSDRPGRRETRFVGTGTQKLPPGIADLWRGEQIEIGG
jgi:uncharacterized phiE125 gp8 family phage protein